MAAQQSSLREFHESLARYYEPHEAQAENFDGAWGCFRPRTRRGFVSDRVHLKSLHHKRGSLERFDDYVFLLLVHAGEAFCAHAGVEARLYMDDLMLIDSRAELEFLVRGRCDFTAVHVRRDSVAALCTSPFGRPIRGKLGLGMPLSRLLHSAIEAGDSLDEEDSALILDAMLGMLEACLTKTPSETCDDDAELKRLRTWALAHMDDPALDPANLAVAYGVSRRQLYRLFASTGKTPATWLRELRLESARGRLAEVSTGRVSITEIALSVGFTDISHFSRTFKEQFGLSPKLFLQRQRA